MVSKIKSVKKNKTKKIDKKVIIVIFAFLLFLFGGFFLYRYVGRTEIDESWGETYYLYLKDVNNNNKGEKAGIDRDSSNAKLNFYKINNVKEPVMVVSYQKNNINYSNVYYIENKKVNTIIYNEPTSIEYLYNIEKNEYDYYFHIEKDGKDYYQQIGEVLEDKKKQPEYSFEKEEKESAISNTGEEISVSKFDTIFVYLDIIKDKGIDYNTSLSSKELLQVIKDTISNYKDNLDIVDEEIKESVAKKVEEISSKLDTIKNLLIENEKKERLESIKNKLMGVWKYVDANNNILVMGLTVERGQLIYKYGIYATGGGDYGKLQNIESINDNIIKLVIYDEGCSGYDCIEEREERTFNVSIDVTNIDNGIIKIDNNTYNYASKDWYGV